ncbi:MAG TPA: hypothetical protein PLD91_01440 [Spirochaetota bacterium]|nr:hypothetical protein [Spirochaetota bacterium]
MKSLVNMIIGIVVWIFNFIKGLFRKLLDTFFEINICEKAIVIGTVLAFAAVVAPMARYRIFDSYFTINNPIAHYMIGIALVMLVTVYFPGLIVMVIRIILNMLYLINLIYLQAAHEISRAPYELSAGYYLNIIIAVVYVLLALGSFFLYGES